MPLYDYKCPNCSTKFEVRRSFEDRSPAICPKCTAQGQLIFSPVAVIFKGPGFYITDTRNNGSTPEEPADDSHLTKE